MKEIITNVRAILALFWSIASAFFIFYILKNWGHEKEILTLIIGLIGGTVLGGIFGVYFGASHKSASTTDTTTTTDIQATITTTPKEEDKN